MRITKVKLDNYVCFYDAPEFELGPGINFVFGKNNSGKTALLDVLSHQGFGDPHRSSKTIDRHFASLSKSETQYEIEYQFDPDELLRFLFADNDSFYFPLAPRDSRMRYLQPVGIPNRFLAGNKDRMRYWYVSNEAVSVKLAEFEHAFPIGGTAPLNCYRAEASSRREGDTLVVQYHVSDRSTHIVEAQDSCWSKTGTQIPKYIYRFLAERSIGAVADFEEGTHLKSDASNLSTVLSVLSASRLEEYLKALQFVIPEIQEILFRPGDGTVELLLSYYPSVLGREDLAVSLDQCGTGVGHILAMLYVVLFYDMTQPRVILIDEPYSFLHPGAVRKLLEIFQEHDHHQYIIATHTPTAIMSVQKKRVLLVEREDMVSTVQGVNVESNADLEKMLNTIGTRRSDIFGMDAVIWVEGKTDEICFNLIMKGHIPSGVQIIGLVNTGDLEDKKHAKLAENIYEKLSGGVGILPSTLAFVFDGDKRPDAYSEADNTNGRTRYLKRQNFENYFLDYSGIPAILSELINNDGCEPPGQPTTSESVQKWIDDNKEKDKFYLEGVKYNLETWPQNVNGARFLTAMFKELAHQTRKYKKVKDGEVITRRILDDCPDHFKEIVDLIKCILDKDRQSEST